MQPHVQATDFLSELYTSAKNNSRVFEAKENSSKKFIFNLPTTRMPFNPSALHSCYSQKALAQCEKFLERPSISPGTQTQELFLPIICCRFICFGTFASLQPSTSPTCVWLDEGKYGYGIMFHVCSRLPIPKCVNKA